MLNSLTEAHSHKAAPSNPSDNSGAANADCQLIAMILLGDESAMASLYDKHSRIVYSIALRVLHDQGMAEDVLQEVFLQIWRRPQTFSAVRGSLTGWLAVIARNRSIDILRQRRPIDSIDDIPVASGYDLAADVERIVMVERVKALIAELPAAQRMALDMAFFEGCTHAEIAERSGVPLGTIKTRIRSALCTLGAAFRGEARAETSSTVVALA